MCDFAIALKGTRIYSLTEIDILSSHIIKPALFVTNVNAKLLT